MAGNVVKTEAEAGRTDLCQSTISTHPLWGLVVSTEDRTWLDTKAVRAFSLTAPDRCIVLLDGKDREIGVIEDLTSLPQESKRAVEGELAGRYVYTKVIRVPSIRYESGVLYCHVESDRGDREFVVRASRDAMLPLKGGALLLIDVDGNRFMVEKYRELDRRSWSVLEQVL